MQGNGLNKTTSRVVVAINIRSSSSSWFSEAIVYHILIDRFAGYNEDKIWQSPEFMGGNLNGIKEKAEYLSDLGINTLWISPFYETDAYHGYHVTDFFKPEPRFGSLNNVTELLSVFHRKNIRVIADFVPNHCSRQHPYFSSALHDRSSEYRNWFLFRRGTDQYATFLNFQDLPKFDLDHREAREYIIEAAKYWLSLGFDGFRLDHVVGPTYDFWREFSTAIREFRPEAVLIGEAWLEGVGFRYLKHIGVRHKYFRWIRGFRPGEIQADYIQVMDGALDFYFRHRITEFIAWKSPHAKYMPALRQKMMDHYAKFPGDYYLPTFVENHDMNRFLFDAGQDKAKLKAALAFQFSLPQPPILYYGTETALSHTEAVLGHKPFSDLQARKPMPWDDLDHEMIQFVKLQIERRKKEKKYTV